MFQFSLEILLGIFFTAINIQRAESHVCLHLSRQLLLSNFNWNWNGRKILLKRSSIKYHEKKSSLILEMLLTDRGAIIQKAEKSGEANKHLFIVKYAAIWWWLGPYRPWRKGGTQIRSYLV